MSLASPLPTRTTGIPPPIEGVEGKENEILSDEEDGNIKERNSNMDDVYNVGDDDEEISNKEVESENEESSNNDEVIKNQVQQKVNDDSNNKKSILNETNANKKEKDEEDNEDLGQKLVSLDDWAQSIRNTMRKFLSFFLKKTSF